MNAFRLWAALTRLVVTGRGRYPVGVILTNPHDLDDPHIDAVQMVTWLPADLDWVDGEDRFATLACTPEAVPAYERTRSLIEEMRRTGGL